MFKSHLPAFLSRLDLPSAAESMGETAVACVREQMLHGYERPVCDTGALMQDVSFAVNGNTVTIGNTLPYAVPVHEGTSRTSGRPYLAEGILNNAEALRQAAAEALRRQGA
ncbi:MAG: hypothetical protein E7316_10505 [Clostridiales bacterium]|nr:hypothetical protein [Clostridiales bacterium]